MTNIKYNIFLWAVILGVVGFLSGFFGPLVLNPDANQGPMFGIFISGPLAFVSGAVMGKIASDFGWQGRKNTYAIIAASIIIAIVTLLKSLP